MGNFNFKDASEKDDRYIFYLKKHYTGLQNVNIQTLRETFGSHLLRKDISIYLVSKYIGYSSIDVTTRHYAYIATQMTYDEINVL